MADRIRILHVITGLNLGGAETWLLRLVSGLDQRRFECRVVSLIPEGVLAEPIRALGVRVESLGMSRGVPSVGALRRLTALLVDWQPQVLQTWLYHADLLGFGAAWWARRRGWSGALAWGIRCAQMDFSRYGLSSRVAVRACAALSGRVDTVVANSQAGAAHHVQTLGYSAATMRVIENGVDARRFRPDAAARAVLRAEWGVREAGVGADGVADSGAEAGGASADAVLVGLVARFDPMKGHALFCRAARLALDAVPGLRFVFCGEGTGLGHAASPEFEELLARHGLAGAVIRLGRRSDVERVLAALDVIALPSLAEGFPNALAEALACGVPAAALTVGDARAIVGPGGVVVPVQGEGRAAGEGSGKGSGAERGAGAGLARGEATARALAEAFVALARAGAQERQRLGEAGRAHVLERYGLAGALANWARHFEELARR